MPIRDDLKRSLVESAKAKDQLLLDTLRSIQSAVRYKEIDKRAELTDPEIQAVIATLCKQHRESIDQFEKGGRADLVAKERRELGILEKFLPQQLSKEEVEKVIKAVISETQAKSAADMGKVMKASMVQLQGKADGRMVNDVVRELLK